MRKVYIAAGGTGGHINAAISLGERLTENYSIKYITGERYLDHKLFKNEKDVLHLKSRALRSKNVLKILISLFLNFWSFLELLFLYIKDRPRFVIGAGGYVCGPTLLAAFFLRIPIFLIEQNAVMGLTNKILSFFATKIFLNFKETKGLRAVYEDKVIISGNPIRQNITTSSIERISDEVSILIFGGSLGASQINEMIPFLIKRKIAKKVKILHQVGKGNLLDLSKHENIIYKQVEYIENMSEAYKGAHIIISRAGASTISELEIVKRPVILIPYPHATDNHQYFNALNLKKKDDFYVGVVDYKEVGEKLANSVEVEIKKILQEDLFYSKEGHNKNAVDVILDGVESCLV